MAVLLCCWRCFSYRGSGAVSWCRGEAVASHHFGERYRVRRAASCGLDDGGHLAEVLRAEDAGADDRQHLRVDLLMVVEAVHDSPRNAEHLARPDFGLFSIGRPGQHALKQESDRQLPDTDLFAWARPHAYLSSSRCFG